jgi:polyhydroxyalkanoate synthesis regulator phasin
MNVKLRSAVMATLASTFLLGFGSNAMADSTYDLVQALVDKGVLTEEEAIPLLKSREADNEKAAKEIKKGRVGISSAIDNAKLYGDVRVRAEYRKGEDDLAIPVEQERTRTRYKVTFGVKTEADDFYADLAFAMGSGGRSDNSTFGSTNGANNKDNLLVKRAMIGWNATEWLTLQAGRMDNPLYTTPMVWDGDLTIEGLSQQVKFEFGDVEFFGTALQSQYEGDRRVNNVGVNVATASTNELLAFQGGAKFKITDDIKAKAAITYYMYTNDDIAGVFAPAAGNGTSFGTNTLATNDLSIIEIPFEVSFAGPGTLGYKFFGDYAVNTDSDRFDRACASTPAVCAAGNDDDAWTLGGEIKSMQDPKGKASTKGDWKAKIWYQTVGAYALDPNTPDSDFFDSRVNMEGVVFKGEYALRDNVFVNFAAGKGERKEKSISAAGTTSADISRNINDFELYQLDMTYKF